MKKRLVPSRGRPPVYDEVANVLLSKQKDFVVVDTAPQADSALAYIHKQIRKRNLNCYPIRRKSAEGYKISIVGLRP